MQRIPVLLPGPCSRGAMHSVPKRSRSGACQWERTKTARRVSKGDHQLPERASLSSPPFIVDASRSSSFTRSVVTCTRMGYVPPRDGVVIAEWVVAGLKWRIQATRRMSKCDAIPCDDEVVSMR